MMLRALTCSDLASAARRRRGVLPGYAGRSVARQRRGRRHVRHRAGYRHRGLSASGEAADTTRPSRRRRQCCRRTPAVEEVKPVEEDVQHVIGSDAGPEQEKIAREPEPEEVKEPPSPSRSRPCSKPKWPSKSRRPPARSRRAAMRRRCPPIAASCSRTSRGKKINPRSRDAGVAVVRFTVGPDGELMSREIATSSGSKTLDDAAIASIEKRGAVPAHAERREERADGGVGAVPVHRALASPPLGALPRCIAAS